MITTKKLTIDIHSYWHQGTGKGSGSYLDALVEKDEKGLPFMNGKMLKGLLRDACNRLSNWKCYGLEAYGLENADAIVENLFGSSGFAGNVARDKTQAGLLRFSNATLPTDIHTYLADKPNQILRNQLYFSLHSTAIEHETGTAKEGSLRGTEVTIPMKLEAEIALFKTPINSDQEILAQHWQDIIETAFPLIRYIGGQRNRGLGRATLSWDKTTQEEIV